MGKPVKICPGWVPRVVVRQYQDDLYGIIICKVILRFVQSVSYNRLSMGLIYLHASIITKCR